MPIWSAALAVLFLGERMSGRKWFAVLLGLVGVAVIVRPGAGAVDSGQMIALASALGRARNPPSRVCTRACRANSIFACA